MDIFYLAKRSLFGHDIFISYSRKDGLDYAYKLADKFIQMGFDCYIDQLSSSTPGKSLPKSVINPLKRSTALVIIGSAGAQDSYAIEEEIITFIDLKKNRPIIPINVESNINQSYWFGLIEGLPLIHEDKQNFILSSPSEDVVGRIKAALRFTRKSKRLRFISIGVCILTALLTVFSYYQFKQAIIASKLVSRANSELLVAQNLTTDARERQNRAESKANIAQKNADDAIESASVADSLKEIALTAKVQADLQAKEATLRRDAALKNLKTAQDDYDVLNTASKAMDEVESNPTNAIELAVASYQKKNNFVAEKAILTAYNSNNILYKARHDSCQRADISQNGESILFINTTTFELYLLETSTNKRYVIDKSRKFQRALFVDQDSTIFALDTIGNICLYKRKGVLANEIKTNLKEPRSVVRYFEDGNFIAAALFDTLYVIDFTSKKLATVDLSQRGEIDFAYAKDISYLKNTDEIVVRDVVGQVNILQRGSPQIKSLNFYSGDGTTEAFTFKDRNYLLVTSNEHAYIYDLTDPKKVKKLLSPSDKISINGKAFKNNEQFIKGIAFSNDKQYVGIYTGHDARVYSLEEVFNNPVPTSANPFSHVYFKTDSSAGFNCDMEFSPNGHFIAVAKQFGDIKIFDRKGRLIGVCKSHNGRQYDNGKILWAPDSRSMLSWGFKDQKLILWDLNTVRKTFYEDISTGGIAINSQNNLFAFVKNRKEKNIIAIYDLKGELLDSIGYTKDAKVYSANQANKFICLADDRLLLWDKSFFTLKNSLSIEMGANWNFSLNDQFLQIRYHNENERWDTVYFDLVQRKEIKEFSREIFFIEESAREQSKWQIEWQAGARTVSFILRDSLNNRVLFQGQDVDPLHERNYKIQHGVITSQWGGPIDLYFSDIKRILNNIQDYKLF